ncbi:MAG: hypothetical protein J6O53_00170, partial [Eubacterium sp.]|nr:hypothetical protein [Eubacterium sp.]
YGFFSNNVILSHKASALVRVACERRILCLTRIKILRASPSGLHQQCYSPVDHVILSVAKNLIALTRIKILRASPSG